MLTVTHEYLLTYYVTVYVLNYLVSRACEPYG